MNSTPEITPWRRWLARIIDVTLAGFAAGVILVVVDPQLIENDLSLFTQVLLTLGWAPLEALLLSSMGTTPGKALFGVVVRTADGRKLDFHAAMRRSFGVWFYGLGGGLPLISTVAMIVAYRRLGANGTTLWDQSAGAVVTHRQLGAIKVIGALVFVMILVRASFG
jgi:uncharacterized RDD family membrane protein YckC